MAPQKTTLLCLVLCLGQRIQAQQEDFPIPIISAVPGSVVPWNESVRILCRGTPQAYQYQLLVLGNSTHTIVEKKLGFQEEAEFVINRVNPSSAGCYRCQYRKRQNSSEPSEPLELVVTGLYYKPFLSTDQRLVVLLGDHVSFQCSSAHIPFDRFSLVKEGEASLSQHQHGGRHGSFTLGPVNHSFAGSYRCYGWHSSSPYVWSAPSDALELIVADSEHRDYTVGNSIRMGVAGLVLMALLLVLAENWHSHRAPHKECLQDLDGPIWSPHKYQGTVYWMQGLSKKEAPQSTCPPQNKTRALS